MSVAERPGIKMPGLRRQRMVRRWTTQILEQRSGIHRDTIERAERGDSVSATTADYIIRALEAEPVSETAREVFEMNLPKTEEMPSHKSTFEEVETQNAKLATLVRGLTKEQRQELLASFSLEEIKTAFAVPNEVGK